MNRIWQHRVSAWLVAMVGVLSVGCDDPIHRPTVLTLNSADWAKVASDNPSRYEWPLTVDGYRVDRPPQMGYVTSFAEKIPCPDPVTAELVPWPTGGADPAMLAFLDQAYLPWDPQLKTLVTLTAAQFAGPQAFDVSEDGKRLVVIDDQGLALYETQAGKLVGHVKLPREIMSNTAPAEAVRFCGKSRDVLVATADTIVRISSKDGLAIAQTEGIGEPIAEWFVNTEDTATMVRGESGHLFGGDSQLKRFADYEKGTVAAAAFSDDGRHIAVAVNQRPQLYVQQDFVIIDQVNIADVGLDPQIDIAVSGNQQAWVDGDGMKWQYFDNEGKVHSSLFHMFWRPQRISAICDAPNRNTFLIAGSRFEHGHEQPILFYFDAEHRTHSLPKVLDRLPLRIAHSRKADRLALLDEDQLKLCEQEVWRTYGPSRVVGWAYRRFDEGKFEMLEQTLEIIQSQTRLGFGCTSETLRTLILDGMRIRLQQLWEKDPEHELLKKFADWKATGSEIALAAEALAQYSMAWEARGSGYATTVSQAGWDKYGEYLQKSLATLQQVVAVSEHPPLAAFAKLIHAKLESEGGLDDVDHLARRATELYPGEVQPHRDIMFKLMPQWYGEPGDATSFGVSASKLFESPTRDLLYLRLAAHSFYWFGSSDPIPFKSFDARSTARGLDECIRQDAILTEDLWRLWVSLYLRNRTQGNHQDLMHRTFKHLIANNPVLPTWISSDGLEGMEGRIHDIHLWIREGGLERGDVMPW